jgi:hypothetical protein
MKAILIDVKTKCLEEIEVGNSLQDVYDAVNCAYVDLLKPDNFKENNALLCDATAEFESVDTLKGGFKSDFFSDNIVFGNALVIGLNDNGTRCDCTVSVLELLDHIQFCEEEEIKEEYLKLNKNENLDLGW